MARGDDGVEDLMTFEPDAAPYVALAGERGPDWLDELELRPAPPFHRMGTHALDLDDWFVVDGLRESELALRSRLLDERQDAVFAALASAAEASEETLALVTAWTGRRGLGPPPPAAHPLAAAGLHVQEDLCLMVPRDGAWHLDAAMLCFPSVWRLHDKLGRSTPEVHAPVDHYADELGDRVDRFFDRLRPDGGVWRRNWSIKATHALHLPYAKDTAGGGPVAIGDDGAPFWLRSERQTLRKLPSSGAILFGIRVQLTPIGVLRRRPDVAARLLAVLESWDGPMRHFKEAGPAAGLVPWLRAVAINA